MSLVNSQSITWTCNGCGRTSRVSTTIGEGARAMLPCLPKGWVVVGERHFCERHLVRVAIDGHLENENLGAGK